jgi:ribosomal protein L7/L12
MGFLDFLFGTRKETANPQAVPFSVDTLATLIREGQMIPAIKMVRLHSHVGLKEAKDFVDFMAEKGLSWDETAGKFPLIAGALTREQQAGFIPPQVRGGSSLSTSSPWENLAPHLRDGFSPQDLMEIEALLKDGRKIEAIKLVRGKTNLGLKEAKDLVESFEISR